MISVRVGTSEVRLSVVPIGEIRPHERTIPSLLESIMRNMRRTGYQRDPILMDEKTGLALDGMHRLKSLELLGAKYVVCALFNASNRSIKVERWLRTFVAPGGDLADLLVKKFEMLPCSDFRSAIRSVESGKSKIAFVSRHSCYIGGLGWTNSEVYRKLGEADKLCEKRHVELHFLSELEKFGLFASESVQLLYPAKLTKGEIATFSARGELLPYKTTRFTVPVRPMGLYFPLSSLRKESITECNEVLQNIVKFSKAILEPKNIWYEGRKYSEQLAIFRRIPRSRKDTINGEPS